MKLGSSQQLREISRTKAYYASAGSPVGLYIVNIFFFELPGAGNNNLCNVVYTTKSIIPIIKAVRVTLSLLLTKSCCYGRTSKSGYQTASAIF